MVLEASVVDCGGPLCRISDVSEWKVASLKKAIERETGITRIEQRLLVGARELSDDDVMNAHVSLASLGGVGAYVCVSLVRRSPEQKAWLQLCRWDDFTMEAFRRAPESVRADRACCLAAVQRDGAALQHAAETVQADLEVVLAAVEHDSTGVAFLHASRELRANRAILLAATRTGVVGTLLLRTPEILSSDRQLIFFAALGLAHQCLRVVEALAFCVYQLVMIPVYLAAHLVGADQYVMC